MSDEETRRAERREKSRLLAIETEAKAKAIKDMQQDQRWDVEDIVSETPDLEMSQVAIIETDLGIVACRKPDPHVMSIYMRQIEARASSESSRGKAKGATYKEAVKTLVLGTRIYPEAEAFDRIFKAYDPLWFTMGGAVSDLGGAGFEADVLKN